MLFPLLFLQRPMGLLALLDEESKFPRASDLSLAGKQYLAFSISILCHHICDDSLPVKFHGNFQTSRYYNKPKDGGPTFTIQHYAGPVSCLIHVYISTYTALTLTPAETFPCLPYHKALVIAFPHATTGDLRDSGVSREKQRHRKAGRVATPEDLREPHSPGLVSDTALSHWRSLSSRHCQQ